MGHWIPSWQVFMNGEESFQNDLKPIIFSKNFNMLPNRRGNVSGQAPNIAFYELSTR